MLLRAEVMQHQAWVDTRAAPDAAERRRAVTLLGELAPRLSARSALGHPIRRPAAGHGHACRSRRPSVSTSALAFSSAGEYHFSHWGISHRLIAAGDSRMDTTSATHLDLSPRRTRLVLLVVGLSLDGGRLGRQRPQRRAAQSRPRDRRQPDRADVDHRRVHGRLRRPAAVRRRARRPLRPQAAAGRRVDRVRHGRWAGNGRHRSDPADPAACRHGRRRRGHHAHHPVGHHHVLPRRASGRAPSASWVGIAGGGAVLGLFVSGLLLEWYSWQSFFASTSCSPRSR